MRRPLMTLAALMAVPVLLAVLVHALGPGGRTDAVPERRRPDLSGRTLDGRAFALGELRGHPVLVSVWASWCDPCRAEFPLLAGAARELDGVRFLGVDLRDAPGAARAFLAETGAASFPHLADPDGRLALELGARGVPETFLLDRQGFIVDRRIGALTQDWIEGHVVPLLTP
ncbi:redoxin domain-containing protein [Nonomuraea phyllanthi]|uniref:Redoxin domain-containing protein n=1 Tax=Nonomuraea phyllanthi TaxID=2219224 RepID=A0A5C4WUX9_9ACTN|nr:TlpA disulfide reductase family protein [Nonomuraea phyllanthi]KAB8197410.1 redoxin domain-containing protein [Nonomuraea phyllanthi]QFY06597.1 redoxin domain-containing protein [Nonomuraea phyllanthi]